jgi:hypothetical protein
VAIVQNPENMQRAAIELERGIGFRATGALFGVSDEAIRKWTKHADWPTYVAAAKAIVRQEAMASNIIPIRPGVRQSQQDADGVETVTTPDTLVKQALNALAVAVANGNVQAATWVLERVDPARFGTPKDRQVMAELQKAAADVAPRKVTVTVTAPVKRKAESA